MTRSDAPGKSFWAIAVLALVWNLVGVANFLVQIFATDLTAFPDWWRAVVETRPGWATAAMAVSVFGGGLGAALLLLRNSAAVSIFILSLAGTFLTTANAITIGDPGLRQIAEGAAMPMIVSLFLVWFSNRARQRRWIG